MKLRFRHWTSTLIITLLILIWVYTSLTKLMDMETFRAVMRQSPFIGNQANLLAGLIPALELGIAVTLCFVKFRKIGLLASAILMSIFTLYIATMLMTASQLPCSCGGVLKQLSWEEHLIFNLVLTMLAFVGYKIENADKDLIAINRSSRIPV